MAKRQAKNGHKPRKDDFVVTCLEVISRKEHAETDLKAFDDIAGGVGLYTMQCATRPITLVEFREMLRMVPEDIITPEGNR